MKLIIEICGVDGSGKSTLISSLRKKINNETDYVAYERNFKSTYKVFLEDIALKNGHVNSLDLFNKECIEFSASLELTKEVHNQLYFLEKNSKQIYFVDKYYTDWMARLKVDDFISKQIQLIYSHLPKPTMSFYIDITSDVAFKRISSRLKGDRLLKSKDPNYYLGSFINSYKNVKKNLPYTQINLDGNKSVDELTQEVFDTMFSNEIFSD